MPHRTQLGARQYEYECRSYLREREAERRITLAPLGGPRWLVISLNRPVKESLSVRVSLFRVTRRMHLTFGPRRLHVQRVVGLRVFLLRVHLDDGTEKAKGVKGVKIKSKPARKGKPVASKGGRGRVPSVEHGACKPSVNPLGTTRTKHISSYASRGSLEHSPQNTNQAS